MELVKGINLIYGECATGKTTFAIQKALECGKKVIFIDTENSFSIERVKQMNKNYKEILKNIFVHTPKSFMDQHEFIKSLTGVKNALIILDTLGIFYRLELQKESFVTNKRVEKQLRILKELSENNDILILNQVYHNFDGKIEMSGGNLVRKNCDCICRFEKEPRIMIIEKPERKEIIFEISDSGLVF